MPPEDDLHVSEGNEVRSTKRPIKEPTKKMINKRKAQEDELMEKALSLVASPQATTQGDADDFFGDLLLASFKPLQTPK